MESPQGEAVGSKRASAGGPRPFLAKFRLGTFLFGLLLVCGIIPLAVTSALLIGQNRAILETQEKSYLTRASRFLSVELDEYLARTRRELTQLGELVLASGEGRPVDDVLRRPWVADHLQEMLGSRSELLALRLLHRSGSGLHFSPPQFYPGVLDAMESAFEEARNGGKPVYRFLAPEGVAVPLAVVAVPLPADAPEAQLVVKGVVRLDAMRHLVAQEAEEDVSVFLVDRNGGFLWSRTTTPAIASAVRESPLIRDFAATPLNMTQEYTLLVDGRERKMIGRVSPVAESGWGIVIQRPAAVALASVKQMVFKSLLSSGILVALALGIGVVAARRVSRPIQQLAATTDEIAAGNFGKRVEAVPLGREISQLADDFNRMSAHLAEYVEQLRQAARANRELFIGSMRAFVAAIDAKDPYTRGHSERVAAYSRTIARHLGLPEAQRDKIWIAALIHDVGKIGIEDRILKKGGVLTNEEYEQMKLHPSIGAEIMSRIEQLKEMIPAIRWHHESWDGKGYPDGLKGEQIPQMARIVAVADTFDAITTNRPYQRAYDAEFAVETIAKIAGTRFDARVVSAFVGAFEQGAIRVTSKPVPQPVPEAEPEDAGDVETEPEAAATT